MARCWFLQGTTCITRARVYFGCLNAPLSGVWLWVPDEQLAPCAGEFSFAETSELLCNESPSGKRHLIFCKRRGTAHQPPNACSALRQDKGLSLTHLSLGQMSKKSPLSFFWLNHQFTKKPAFVFTGGLGKLQLARKGAAAAYVGLSLFSLHSLSFFRGK